MALNNIFLFINYNKETDCSLLVVYAYLAQFFLRLD
jgi:hypothetical protein